MYYDAPQNFVAYDPSKWTLTITSSSLDNPLVVDGLHTFNGQKTNPTHTVTEANSGMATPNVSHSQTGTFDFEVWDSSPSNAILDTLMGAGTYVAFTCANPTLPGKSVSSTYAFFAMSANAEMDKEAKTVSYKLICVNYKSTIGSSEVAE